MLQKLSNSKILLALEIVLILFGLILSTVAVWGSVGGVGVPGKNEETGIPESQSINSSSSEMSAGNVFEIKTDTPPDGTGDMLSFYIGYVAPLLVYILLAVYVLLEYRKPHGNLFRLTMLFYALMLVLYSLSQGSSMVCQYILPCTAVIVAYLSGRLNKIKKNIWWIAVVTLLVLSSGLLRAMTPGPAFGILQFASYFGALIQWLALVLAYISRFEQHRLAGAQ